MTDYSCLWFLPLFCIYLLQNYNARISDFGVAELGPIFVESHVSTRVVGTYAYAAPEYFGTGNDISLKDGGYLEILCIVALF